MSQNLRVLNMISFRATFPPFPRTPIKMAPRACFGKGKACIRHFALSKIGIMYPKSLIVEQKLPTSFSQIPTFCLKTPTFWLKGPLYNTCCFFAHFAHSLSLFFILRERERESRGIFSLYLQEFVTTRISTTYCYRIVKTHAAKTKTWVLNHLVFVYNQSLNFQITPNPRPTRKYAWGGAIFEVSHVRD